jgi:hypothetical protein
LAPRQKNCLDLLQVAFIVVTLSDGDKTALSKVGAVSRFG